MSAVVEIEVDTLEADRDELEEVERLLLDEIVMVPSYKEMLLPIVLRLHRVSASIRASLHEEPGQPAEKGANDG